MARFQGLRPPLTLGQRALREHDERRALARMKRARRHPPQHRAIISEQARGGRIGIDDPVGDRIEHQHRLVMLREDGAEIVDRSGLHVDRPSYENS